MRTRAMRPAGFTLIEMLITVAILILIAAIAVPNYRNHVLRANRTDAKAALTRIAAAQEKFYLQNNSYTADLGPNGLNTDASSQHYALVVGSDDLTTGFIATATPTGGQLQDKTCHSLRIDNFGNKTAADSENNDSSAACWR